LETAARAEVRYPGRLTRQPISKQLVPYQFIFLFFYKKNCGAPVQKAATHVSGTDFELSLAEAFRLEQEKSEVLLTTNHGGEQGRRGEEVL
jgi:hypothetical protein